MGMFSFRCKECRRSVLAPISLSPASKAAWMIDVIIHLKDGSVLLGTYDGYGRIEMEGGNTFEIPWADHKAIPCIRHLACWKIAKEPGYTGPSEDSGDQGHFHNDKDYEFDSPVETGKPLPPIPDLEHTIIGVRR